MANSNTSRRVAVLGGNRIPFARSDGAYANASNQDMFTAALGGLVDRFELAGETARRGDRRRGAQAQPRLQPDARMRARQRAVVVHAGVRPPAGLRHGAAGGHRGRRRIAAGRYEVAAAGGVDTASDAPIAFGDDLRRVLLGLRRSKSNVDRLKLVGKLPASLGVEIPVNSEPRTGLSMGEHAAITAKQMGIKRVDQDELAAASHRNMAAAYDRGFFDDLVTPFLGLYRDNNLRPDSSAREAGEAASRCSG